ncbi:MAG: flagellar basal body L-ring protein FlgH, partial [Chlamydiia bacterium]|nr:flagellar basal body L-ring protein FlgH [Chlamydiia bacterium]
ILTVIVEESATTKNDGKSTSERKNTQGFSLSKFFFPYFKPNQGLDDTNGSGDPIGFDWSSNNKFEGSGKNDSQHKLYTVMQVRIIEEIRDGHFYIKGFRKLNIDGKEKEMFISGVIRQRDIAPDNTILSSRIADAEIEIEGEMSNEVLKPGLLHRLLNFVL